MNQRHRRKVISSHFFCRFYGESLWRSAEDTAWDNMALAGREFGSPDYDRLMQEDFDNKAGVFKSGLAETWKKKIEQDEHMELPSD